MNRKVKSFKQTLFLLEQHNVLPYQQLQQVFEVLYFGLVYCPVDDTLFKMSLDLRYFSCVKSLLFLHHVIAEGLGYFVLKFWRKKFKGVLGDRVS